MKGLIAEMLDFKAIAMKLTNQSGEQSRAGAGTGADRAGNPLHGAGEEPGCTRARCRTGTERHGNPPQERPQAGIKAEPAEPEMVRIMQTDGTMKMEVRRGDKNPRDSTGSGRRK